MDNWYLWFLLFIIFFIILPTERKQEQLIKLRKKGVQRKMPKEIIKEFVNKECVICLFNGHGVQGTIVAVEDNWIKVQEKKKVRLINGDMIADIYTKSNV